MTVEQLRDHAQQMLETIATDLDTTQSNFAQKEKSQGRGPHMPGSPDSASQIHAGMRAESGLSLEQMVSEYRALRASVLRLWIKTPHGNVGAAELEEMTRFNEAIDQAVAESTARFNLLLNRERDVFLAVLGHDLRTPLGTILMSAKILTTSAALNDQYRAALTRIVNSGTRMKQMVNDLLDFTITRMHSSLKISPAAMDIGIVAHRIADEIKGLHPEREFQVLATGNLQGSWDHVRIGQLMANLLLNALQHGAASAPITMTVQSESDDEVRLMVRNEGVPIPAAFLPGIFEPLKSAPHDEDANKQGTPAHLGLGLYIAREIVAAHGGSIGVTSIPEGTTFTVRLPRYSSAAVAD
jgi:signal transduction histidine kinase